MVTARASEEWRALMRRPGYLSFTLTVAVSRIVGAMFIVAGVLLVLERTGSAPLAGAVSAAAVFPGALSGPWLGAWLDVVRRRRALIVADRLVSVVALVALVALAGHAPDWTLPAVAVLYGVTSPVSYGSFASALSTLAGAELLDRASAIEATSMNLSIVVGPALSGLLAGGIGAARVIELQAALTVLVSAAIAVNSSFEAREGTPTGTIVEAMHEGTRALVGNRLLRDASSASLLGNVSWGLMVITFPLYAERALHVGRNAAGYLWAAIALGSIVGTFALSARAGARHPTASRGRIAVSYVAVALSSLLWLLAGSLAAGLALIGLTGLLEGPSYAGVITLRQRLAPSAARTQVLNTLASLSMVANSTGSALGGILADPSRAIMGFCALNLIAAAIIGRRAAAGPAESESAPVPAGYEAGLGARSREERYCDRDDDTRA
jgi:MFS family permease